MGSSLNSIPLDDKESWQHNIFVPYVYGLVEAMKPRIIAAIFNDPYYLSVEAQDHSFLPFENRIRNWLLWKLDSMSFEDKIKMAVGDSLMFPASWMKVLINKLRTGNGEDDYNYYIDVARIDYLDVWTDFAYRRQMTDVFHRIESNANKIGLLMKNGVYDESKFEMLDKLSGDYNMDIPDRKAIFESMFMSLGNQGVDKEKEKKQAGKLNKIELIEWQGSYDWNDDGIDEPIVVTLANRKEGLRIDKYEDGISIFPIRNGKNSTIIYGRPIAQQVEGLQEELNDKRSKRFDALERLLNMMYKARRTATIDWDNLFSAPDNVLLMDDIHNDLDTIRGEPVPRAAYEEENYIKADAQFATGAQDFNAQGIVGAKGTATGVNAILSESATKFRTSVEDAVNDIIPLVNFIFLKVKKYSSEKESIRIMNTQRWETVTAKEQKGNYRIKLGISNITTLNKELRIQLLTNLMNIAGRVPGLVNLKEFIKRILLIADLKHPENVMGKEETSIKQKIMRAKQYIKNLKRKKVMGELETGMEGVTDRILGAPIAPFANQSIESPALDIISQMTGGTTGGGQQNV